MFIESAITHSVTFYIFCTNYNFIYLYQWNFMILHTNSDLLKFLQVDFEWAVKLNRITLDFLGLWPKTTQSSREKLMCNFRILIAFLGLMLCVLIPSIHSLIRIYGDIMLMIDNLNFTLPTISCSIRIAIFWWKKEGKHN